MLSLKQQQDIAVKFEEVKALASERAEKLFKILDSCNEEEKVCMQYLFAYMPLSDLANYEGSLFLKFVRQALKVRAKMPWGEKLEDTLFLNDVLQYRINNENIEFFSQDFFEAIYPHIKNLSMYEAAVAVNYWCYEKATYQSTDIRTASPFTVLRNAYGRCGEESTLAVAALRSVGIPARQCYTPRWAHCDDNHAWVEAWIDGKWCFLGACEPEIRLNTGWFRLPASRGMLIHNRVFSDLVEDEIITSQTPRLTEINILHHYAKTKEVKVKVVNEIGKALEKVNVRFEIVNYAELYPIAKLKTDAKGEASFVTGLGDIVVYAHDEKKYVYEKVDVRTTDYVELILSDKNKEVNSVLDSMQVPPVGGVEEEEKLSEAEEVLQKERNAKAEEIRRTFEATFYRGEKATQYGQKCAGFQKEIAYCLEESRGNYAEIIAFLEDEETKAYFEYKVALLEALNKKDLSDITADILKEHFVEAMPYRGDYTKEIFINTVANPRVAFEMITSYRKAILAYFAEVQKEKFRANPKTLYLYLEDVIKMCDELEYATLSASPVGLLELKVGNELSKKILFVAICRTLGIAAKLEKSDGILEFYKEGVWHSVVKCEEEDHLRTACLTLKKADKVDFHYYRNYTLARLEKGQYTTLEFEDKAWEGNRMVYNLRSGIYRVLTANRLPDGTLLNRMYHVQIEENEHKELEIELVEGVSQGREIQLKDRNLINSIQNQVTLSEVLGKCNNIVAWLEVSAEPTEHLLNEIIEAKDKFNRIKPTTVLILKKEEDRQDPTLIRVLREVPHIQVVVSGESIEDLTELYEAFGIGDKKLPLALVVEEKQTATFAWSGYNVGIGEMLLKNLKN